MILKSFEISKLKLNQHNFFLFYGDNEGLKEETIKNLFETNYRDKIHRYEEKEILDNKNDFFNSVLTKSFFDNKKLIIINRATDKIKETIESLISQQLINILIERSRGDRKNLNNELAKIESFSLNKKNINLQEIIKLTNLADNYSASELIDHSLAKNTRKTVTILNENNFSDEDSIIIIRTLLVKLKRLVKIYVLVDENNNIDQAVSSFKPPIFWKDKPLVTQQIKSWGKDKLKILIYESNQIEFLIKKNSSVGKNILSDFIINNSKKN